MQVLLNPFEIIQFITNVIILEDKKCTFPTCISHFLNLPIWHPWASKLEPDVRPDKPAIIKLRYSM